MTSKTRNTGKTQEPGKKKKKKERPLRIQNRNHMLKLMLFALKEKPSDYHSV